MWGKKKEDEVKRGFTRGNGEGADHALVGHKLHLVAFESHVL